MSHTELLPDAATRRARLRYYRMKRRAGMSRGAAWLLMLRLCMSTAIDTYGRSGQSYTLTRPRGTHAVEMFEQGTDKTVWTLARTLDAPSETVRYGQGYWIRHCLACGARIMFASFVDYMAGEYATACRSCQGTIGQPVDPTWPSDQHAVKVTGRKPTSRLVTRRGVAGVLGRIDRTTDDRVPWQGVTNPDTRDALTGWLDSLASLPARADGTRRTLAVSRATDQVSRMVGLDARTGTEAMSWSAVRLMPDVIGLHTARHRCGIVGYWPSAAIRVIDADGERFDMADSPSGQFWTLDRYTLDSLASCSTSAPVSHLAPTWRELARGLRWQCERPSVRASEREQCQRVQFTSDRTAIVWAVLPDDHPRWTWPDGATSQVPMFYGRECQDGLTYRIAELVGPIGQDGGVFIGHRYLPRGEQAGHTPELDAMRYTDSQGTRHTSPVRDSRLVTRPGEPLLVAIDGGTVDQVGLCLSMVLTVLASDGDMAELAGRGWSGRASRSQSGRFAFTGALASGEPVRVAGQRSAESLASRLALFVS